VFLQTASWQTDLNPLVQPLLFYH